eukprot:SAG31_NODE_28869_length_404_cov_0.842623_1_plen_134_part_11
MGLLKGSMYFDSVADAPVYDVSAAQLSTISEDKPADFNHPMPLYCWESQLTGKEWNCAVAYHGCGGTSGVTSATLINETSCFESSPDICGRDIQGNTMEVIKSLVVIVICAMLGYFTLEPCFGRSKMSKLHNLR